MALFDLLQHRIGLASGEHVAGQQQQRNAVRRGGGGGGDHIGGARPDRRGAGDDFAAQLLFGVAGSGMRHALLVAALMHHQIAIILFQRLTQSQHVAVAENREDTFDEFGFASVDGEVLIVEEFHQRLRCG